MRQIPHLSPQQEEEIAVRMGEQIRKKKNNWEYWAGKEWEKGIETEIGLTGIVCRWIDLSCFSDEKQLVLVGV